MANNIKSVKSEESNSVRFQIGSHVVYSAPYTLDTNATIANFAKWLADNQVKLEASYAEQKPALNDEQVRVAKGAVLRFFTKTKNDLCESGILIGVVFSSLKKAFPTTNDDDEDIAYDASLRSSIQTWITDNRVMDADNTEYSRELFVSKKGRNGGFHVRSLTTLAAELGQ